ncbi:hypothetical protein [Acidiphilium iwatense]|uniref:Uncharacterized protein n=1 Tax=Acidiphilium iwatense TaxID=768198 RepID=A0ABS9DZR2_9PROT|nr:hypothetical protein [Acidiphilium iwatense]MCF3948189.1 hypothetical protein [Acidiphilium iwatense]
MALEHVDTGDFERFGQALYAELMGREFVPLGGMHDGGAEGYLEPELFGDNEAHHFVQVSKQRTYRAKIRGTVNRLRQYGRHPLSLAYITSVAVPDLDSEEELLSDELNCRIRIRDARYIETQVNRSDATIAAFNAYLRPHLNYLFEPGAAEVAPRSSSYVDRTLAVFLRQEIEHRRGRTDLLESVADSLIIWSLSDTDPDLGKFMNRTQMLSKIEQALPSSRHYIRGVLDSRLERLRRKSNTDGRQVRYYSSNGQYCLPFETRELIAAENIEDDSLRVAVNAVLERRCRKVLEDEDAALIPQVVAICQDVLQRLFEQQGLQVAQFVTDGDQDDELYANAAALITEAVDVNIGLVENATSLRRLSTRVLRGTFYGGTNEERRYLEKLSKTYVLLLMLRNEPKVVEYFKSISSKFNLYIGTDFLVRALSEHFLDEENQTTRNLFKILKKAGAKLILTEKAVEELATHLRAQIFEFESVYMHIEQRMTLEMVEYIDRILIRSYFYARLAPISDTKPPAGFRSYIENFASFAAIRNETGDNELARYLITKFGFDYESAEEMRDGVDSSEIATLAADIVAIRADHSKKAETLEILAENDALQVYAIYAKRRRHKEGIPSNPFGYQTWWLTQDSKVRRAAAPVIAKQGGHRFMMRPEFLINFIFLAPSAAEVSASYKTIFPSVLGVRLSNRVADRTFRNIVRQANEMWSVDEERAGAIIADLTDKLKGDTLKVYETEWQGSLGYLPPNVSD